MRLVVDTSVIIAVVASESQRDWIVRVTRGSELLAPPSVPWEVGNALSAMLRRRRVEPDQALQAVEAFRRIPVRLVDVELEEALAISGEQGIYAYDAYVIRCALKYRAPLMSLDRRLMETAYELGVDVLEVGP